MCVDDAHVHSHARAMVQERRVTGTTDGLIASEGERDVANATGDLAARAHVLDLSRGQEEVHPVVVVLRKPGADCQNVGVEDDILGVESNLLDQDTIRALAH